MKVENAVEVEPVGEFELKGIRRPLAAYNVLGADFALLVVEHHHGKNVCDFAASRRQTPDGARL